MLLSSVSLVEPERRQLVLAAKEDRLILLPAPNMDCDNFHFLFLIRLFDFRVFIV